MLPEKLRDAVETLRHGASPDDLHAGFINRVHQDSCATLFVQFCREADMIGVVVCENHGTQLIEAESDVFQSCPECCAGVRHTYTGIDQRPPIVANKSIDIDGSQRKRDRQSDFPDIWSNLASFGKRLIRPVRLHRGSLLHS